MCARFQLVLCIVMSLATLAALRPTKRNPLDDLPFIRSGNAAVLSIIIQDIPKDFTFKINESIAADIAALTWIKDTLKTKDSLNYATLLEILLADIGHTYTLDEETLLYFAKNMILDLQVHVHK